MRILSGREAWSFIAEMEERGVESKIFMEAVEPIVRDVRSRGDAAVSEHLYKMYGVDLSPEEFRIPRGALEGALEEVPEEVISAIEEAAERVREFHELQVPSRLEVEVDEGVYGIRWVPLERIGIHVPEYEDVAYVSTLISSAVPAQVAGVEEVAVFTPPLPEGSVSPVLLAACSILGIEEVYRVGGPVAVAAMAYGTETIEAVDKVFGSGDWYFMAAKRLVRADVATDPPSGPSESVVLAMPGADAEEAAWEIVSQAEHDVDSLVILVAASREQAEEIVRSCEEVLERIPRRDVAREALRSRGAVLVFERLEDAVTAVNLLAPERVRIVPGDRGIAERIRNAGAVFCGSSTPSVLGDYAIGMSQLLPSAGFSRSYGAVTVVDFMRAEVYAELNERGAAKLARLAKRLAEIEGLYAHAMAAERISTSRP